MVAASACGCATAPDKRVREGQQRCAHATHVAKARHLERLGLLLVDAAHNVHMTQRRARVRHLTSSYTHGCQHRLNVACCSLTAILAVIFWCWASLEFCSVSNSERFVSYVCQ